MEKQETKKIRLTNLKKPVSIEYIEEKIGQMETYARDIIEMEKGNMNGLDNEVYTHLAFIRNYSKYFMDLIDDERLNHKKEIE